MRSAPCCGATCASARRTPSASISAMPSAAPCKRSPSRHRKETMRFSLFVHMERSDPAKSHAELFAESEELVLMAEEAGFETAWIGEHHAMEFTIAPNPFIHLAYLGAKTKKIRL